MCAAFRACLLLLLWRLPAVTGVTVTLSTAGGLGLRFDGIGAISGGGATSKLLNAYPPQQRSEILDLLFKPSYGASLHILKVEIGGDGQATEGTESSHMHTPTDEAYDRGYEWSLMKEAKQRNPAIQLYGLPWTFPGWVTRSGQGGHTGNDDLNAVAQVLTPKTADYVARWIDGAYRTHGLTIDWVGMWNEHPPTPDYALLLRRALDASAHGTQTRIVGPDWHTAHGSNFEFGEKFGNSFEIGEEINSDSKMSYKNNTSNVDIGKTISNYPEISHYHAHHEIAHNYTLTPTPKKNSTLTPFMKALHNNATVANAIARVGFHYPKRLANAAQKLGPLYLNLPSPVWSSEESSTTDTPAGGACWARLLNQNYVVGNITATIMWNLLTSFYTSLPYFGASLMNAAEPWSGHYEIKSPVWATAHHTQFTQPGWHYLSHGNGVGYLPYGGTMVTLVAPSAHPNDTSPRDWTVVMEKIRASTGPCLRDSFTNDTMATENVTLVVGTGLKGEGVEGEGVKATGVVVQMWVSDWGKGAHTSESDLFQYAGEQPVVVGADGLARVHVTVGVDQVVTLSSLSRAAGYGQHGAPPNPPPPPAPFPSHYENDFDSAVLRADEPYLSDQAGHWEVRVEDEEMSVKEEERRVEDEEVSAVDESRQMSGRNLNHSNQVLRHVVPQVGVVYRGDYLPIAVLGSVGWVNASVSLRFRLESDSALGFYIGLRVLNHQATPGDPAKHPLPQATEIEGMYLVFHRNGTTAVVSRTNQVRDGRPAPSPLTPPVSPLTLHTWYNLSVLLEGQQLRWSLNQSQATVTLDESGGYPSRGQLAIGLVDYGLASIDDLVVDGVEGQ